MTANRTASGRRRCRQFWLATTALVAIAAPSATACSHSSGNASRAEAGNPGGTNAVKVTMASNGGKDGCALNTTSVAAGPVTFTVANTNAPGISEVELLRDQRIVGEKENLAPGLDPVSFTVTLDGGAYQLYCPRREHRIPNPHRDGQSTGGADGHRRRHPQSAPRNTRGTSSTRSVSSTMA